MKRFSVVLIALVLTAVAILHQNCGSSGKSLFSNSSSSGPDANGLDIQFRYKTLALTAGSKTLSLDGSCLTGKFPTNRIQWQTNINGVPLTGSVDNGCNPTNKYFFFNLNLSTFNITEGMDFVIVGTIVGIDSKGKLVYGPSRSIEIVVTKTGGTTTGDGTTTGTTTGTSAPTYCTLSTNKITDLHQANTIYPNAVVADYAQTATISNVTVDPAGGQICIYHDKLGVWPATDPFGDGTATEGNYWFVAFHNGQWYTWAFTWYRPNQPCKSLDFGFPGEDSGVGGGISPVTNWLACPGSQVGVVASTPGRVGIFGPVQERSQIYWFTWR